MRASLQSSMVRFREDFSRELGNLAIAVQLDPGSAIDSKAAVEYVQRIESWKRAAAHPELLQGVYVFQHDGNKSRLLRLNLSNDQFEPTEWPARLERLKQPLSMFSGDIAFFDHRRRIILGERRDGMLAPADTASSSKLTPAGPGPLMRFHAESLSAESGGRDGAPGVEHRQHPDEAPPLGARMFPRMPWMVDESGWLLTHFQFMHQMPGPKPTPPSVSCVIIELNEGVIRNQVFPQLAQAHFSGAEGLDYDVAIADQSHDSDILYTSTPSFDTGVSDAAVSLLGGFGGPDAPQGAPVTLPAPFFWSSRVVSEPRYFGFPGPVRVERFRFGDRGPGWVLMARHRKGSLEAALASMHRRQLAMSFGALLLLAATMAMIIVATRRAQRLARLQMDFVAGVSHELRTPLSVIGSAAENIADGIVDDKQKIARYGGVIRDSARQLTQLVEQILLFAATRQEHCQYVLAPVQPSEIVKLALDNSAELIREAGFEIENDIEPDLPPVMVDLPAVSHCLQNLISNAVKYGGETRWLRVCTKKIHRKNGVGEIQISVEDKGIGIAHSDLERIFDPFYRSPAVASAQIHGTGLGLALAKGIAEAMHGTLSVTSDLGRGSSFVLHLPCAEQTTLTPEEKSEPSTIYYEPERTNR